MYQKIAEFSEPTRLHLLTLIPPLTTLGGPDKTTFYQVSDRIDLNALEMPDVLAAVPRKGWSWAWCVILPPGGWLHKHIDGDAKEGGLRNFHFVLTTNPGCESKSGGVSCRLEKRGVYVMPPWVEHESFNRGETDRAHIVLVAEG